MGDVGAADVERPGDRVRVGDHQRVGARCGDFSSDAGKLGVGVFAGIAKIVQRHRARRRLRPIAPQSVDWVGFRRDRRRTGIGAGFGEAFGAVHGMQPLVVTELGVLRQIGFDPLLGRCFGARHDRERRGIDLVASLQRVAPVDEQRRFVGEHHRTAGRTGEAGKPSEPLVRGGHVFVLMTVGARYDEAGEAALRQFGAQRRDTGPGRGGPGSSNDWKRASNIGGLYGWVRGGANAARIQQLQLI